MQATIGYIILILIIVILGRVILIGLRKFATILAAHDKLLLDYITMLEHIIDNPQIEKWQLNPGKLSANITLEGRYKDRLVKCGFSRDFEGDINPFLIMKLNKPYKYKLNKLKLFITGFIRITKHTIIGGRGDWIYARIFNGLVIFYKDIYKKILSRDYIISMLDELCIAAKIVESSKDVNA